MRTLVFNWGNTLLKVFSDYSRPMADRPQVEMFPAMDLVLGKLSPEYHLVVAVCSRGSDAAQVQCALARENLDKYFHRIITSDDVGFAEPLHAFYEKISAIIGGDQAPIMIGDDYEKDVCAAVEAGWLACWYNPVCLPCPALLPFHLVEINKMEELPDHLGNLDLPTYQTAMNWLITHHANTNLLLHSQSVAAVSYLLAVWLHQKGIPVDPILAHRGGLLHDIAKLTERDPNDFETDHAELGSRILLDAGQPILAEIAHSHLISSLYDEKRRPSSWEQKIVHYADKIVEGASVVMLEERIQAICKRYPHHAERILGSVTGVKQLQKEICHHLGYSPDELKEQISNALFGNLKE